jgi:hypothetical protein
MGEQDPQTPDPDDPMPSFKVFCLFSPDGLSDPQASGWDGPGWYFWEFADRSAGEFGYRCLDEHRQLHRRRGAIATRRIEALDRPNHSCERGIAAGPQRLHGAQQGVLGRVGRERPQFFSCNVHGDLLRS